MTSNPTPTEILKMRELMSKPPTSTPWNENITSLGELMDEFDLMIDLKNMKTELKIVNQKNIFDDPLCLTSD